MSSSANLKRQVREENIDENAVEDKKIKLEQKTDKTNLVSLHNDLQFLIFEYLTDYDLMCTIAANSSFEHAAGRVLRSRKLVLWYMSLTIEQTNENVYLGLCIDLHSRRCGMSADVRNSVKPLDLPMIQIGVSMREPGQYYSNTSNENVVGGGYFPALVVSIVFKYYDLSVATKINLNVGHVMHHNWFNSLGFGPWLGDHLGRNRQEAAPRIKLPNCTFDGLMPLLRFISLSKFVYRGASAKLFRRGELMVGDVKCLILQKQYGVVDNVDHLMECCRSPTIVLSRSARWSAESFKAVLNDYLMNGLSPRIIKCDDSTYKRKPTERTRKDWIQLYTIWKAEASQLLKNSPRTVKLIEENWKVNFKLQ